VSISGSFSVLTPAGTVAAISNRSDPSQSGPMTWLARTRLAMPM
jgi:hypothetical protein